MNKMNKDKKDKINALTKLFYKMQGHTAEDEYDFSKSQHPQERLLWNQAVIAYVFLMNDFPVSKYQI